MRRLKRVLWLIGLMGAVAPALLLQASRGPSPAAPRAASVASSREAPNSDWPMFGGTPRRNMLSPGRDPPVTWDVEKGQNVLWTAELGSQSYGVPVVAGGVVYVGTNNDAMRDPAHRKDGGVLMAFDARTGEFLWQRYAPKLAAGRVNDWPFQGQCGAVYVEGSRLWYATSRCETVCLDVRDRRHPRELWTVDMIKQLGVFPHNMTRCHLVAWQDLLYVITGNGVDEGHKHVPAPQAPAIVCLDKNSGRVVWTDNTPADGILHGQWASPAVAELGERALVIAPLGDGWVYAYDARTGKVRWKFDTNPKDSVYPRTRNELLATPVIDRDRMYIATGQDPEHGEGPGRLWCVDITGEGDVSAELADGEPAAGQGDEDFPGPPGAGRPRRGRPNPNSRAVWVFDKFDFNGDGRIRNNERMNRTLATVAITNGLVFAADFSGFVHCLDADTGRCHWNYDMEAAMWEGPLAVDGKVYQCDEDGDVVIFDASRELKVVATQTLGNSIYAPPVYANGMMYLMTKDRLIAVQEKR